VRLLGAEFGDPEALIASLEALREPLAESYAALDRLAGVTEDLPHRADVIPVNHGLARRILDAHAAWLDEAQAVLRDAAARRR
jgi:hypothetical protein